jgi:hypothetical protein
MAWPDSLEELQGRSALKVRVNTFKQHRGAQHLRLSCGTRAASLFSSWLCFSSMLCPNPETRMI